MNKVDIKYRKESISFTEGLIRKHGLRDTLQNISNAIHNLSSDGDAIGCTYQILFYSLCLKHIKENYNGIN